ncbi:TPA: hypothetical protein DDW35_04645, partial [Candidatus Sumerlaeota bacterium]|nr:hypothetical protein [Candidatus Sumerlaeota bacterium]
MAAPSPRPTPVPATPKPKLATPELKPVLPQIIDADAVTTASEPVNKNDAPSTGTLAWPDKKVEPPPLVSPSPTPSPTPALTPILTPVSTPVPARTPLPVAKLQLNLNLATEEELTAVPGLDRVRARLIVAHRQAIGKFTRLDQLLQVSGISETVFNRVQSHLTVEHPS